MGRGAKALVVGGPLVEEIFCGLHKFNWLKCRLPVAVLDVLEAGDEVGVHRRLYAHLHQRRVSIPSRTLLLCCNYDVPNCAVITCNKVVTAL